MMKPVDRTSSLIMSGVLPVNPELRARRAPSACGFMSLENFRSLSRDVQDGTVGLVTLDCVDFETLAAGFGEDLGLMLLGVLLDKAMGGFAEFFPCCRVTGVEKTGIGGYAIFFRTDPAERCDLFDAYAGFRFRVQEAIGAQSARYLEHPLALRIGMALLDPRPGEDLDKTLFRALLQARRVAESKPDSERFAMHREFMDMLTRGDIQTLFQPVVDFATGGVLGWEALARGGGDGLMAEARTLFGFAAEVGESLALERLCLTRALAAVPAGFKGRLFLNVHTQSLHDAEALFAEVRDLAERAGVAPSDVVLEFSERNLVADQDALQRKLELCRAAGLLIAVDDVGAGTTNLHFLSQVRPDFIKADGSLIRGIESNPIKRTMIETLVLLAQKVGGKLLAEGVETETEFSSLVSMGVYAGQGHLFARPAAALEAPQVEVPSKIDVRGIESGELNCRLKSREIAQQTISVPAGTAISEVKAALDGKPPMSSIVIVRGDRPVGLLMNYNLDRRLGTKYGISLYYNRPVDVLMDTAPLIVDAEQAIEEVAGAAMQRANDKIYDDIIVVDRRRLLGTISVQKMLDTLMRVQIELAKGSNPLTGLPGNVTIEQEIEKRNRQKTASGIMYLDLDNFKAYNDVYGFKSGDRVIMATAQIIRSAVAAHGRPSDFIGHIGGDDFLLIGDPTTIRAVCDDIARQFEERIPEFYSEQDRRCGYIEAKGRDGQPARFPLVSASMGILDATFEYPVSQEELSHRAAEIKKFAKATVGNSVVRDRRAPLGSQPTD